jgi:hypothetical protein
MGEAAIEPKYRTCDTDCLSCDFETYLSCERRLNPDSYAGSELAQSIAGSASKR